MAKRLSIAEFKEQATEKFGGKFEYDRVGIIHSKEAVEIFCPEHGYFTQLPHLHLRSKYGCPKCGGTGKKTTADFVKKAIAVHGDMYDYNRACYVSSKIPVIVTCKRHGDFSIAPSRHYGAKKQGCPECSREKRSKSTRMSKKDFICKAIKIHGNKYSYDKVEYTGYTNSVILTCPRHGDFLKTPANHLHNTKPQGCPKCYVSASRKTTEQFVAEAQEVHGDFYEYKSVKYTGNKDKVVIICRIHGAFEQEAKSHLNGHGCPSCSGGAHLTTTDFINKAHAVWGDKYSYDKSIYVSNNEQVTITCHDHGDFKQRSGSHLNGYEGCPKCHERGNIDLATFIEMANEKHKGKFDYSEVAFKSVNSIITINCPIHGSFQQKVKNHLKSAGCRKCAYPRLTTGEFVKKAQAVHGELYGYSSAKYLSSNENVEIHCRYHGAFSQRASHHLQGSGCPICRQSRGEFLVGRVLEKLGVEFEQQKRFPDCRHINELPFDFFVEEGGGVIEFQGEQHYRPVDFGKGDSNIDVTRTRDQIKESYCQDKGIPMLIINFDELDQLEVIIKKFIAKLLN